MLQFNIYIQKMIFVTAFIVLFVLTYAATLFIPLLKKDEVLQISQVSTPTVEKPQGNPPTFVALQYFQRGEKLTTDAVEPQDWFGQGPVDMISDEVEIVGKIAKKEIVPGQVIRRDMLLDAAEWKRGCSRIDAEAIVCFRPDKGYFYGSDGQNRRWTIDFDSTIFDTLAMANRTIYFWRKDEHLYAIDAQTGEELWEFQDSEVKNIVSSASPVIFDNILIFWSHSHKHLYALDAETGQEKWKLEAKGLVTYPAMIADGVISVKSSDGYLYAVNVQTGQELWQSKQ